MSWDDDGETGRSEYRGTGGSGRSESDDLTRRGFLGIVVVIGGAVASFVAAAVGSLLNVPIPNPLSDGREPSGGGSGLDDAGTHRVVMTDRLAFEPVALTIDPGETVVWENVGSIEHTVTPFEDGIPDDAEYFASGGYDSEAAARAAYPEEDDGEVDRDESYEHTFETPGEYDYYCIPHEAAGMVGTVAVEERSDDGGE